MRCMKRGWSSKKAAKRAARQTETYAAAKVGPVTVYWCDVHGMWHVGHARGSFRERVPA